MIFVYWKINKWILKNFDSTHNLFFFCCPVPNMRSIFFGMKFAMYKKLFVDWQIQRKTYSTELMVGVIPIQTSKWWNVFIFQKLPLTPWIKIITSAPVWGLIVAQVGHDWGLFTIITDLPKYMKQVLRYSVAEVSGILKFYIFWNNSKTL